MKRTAFVATLILFGASLAWSSATRDPAEIAIQQSLSERDHTHDSGVEALREMGQRGLDALLEARDAQRYDASEASWTVAIDEVAAQRDATWSGLFWHTDLEVAKQASAATGRPILSLRMLGDLRDSESCANSRFFRSVLYANPDVADHLREQFVLHWSSERDVPIITIDFGDGRVLHRTITGNSAHYVLDSDGRPLDVIPGLMTPDVFLSEVDEAADLHDAIAAEPSKARAILTAHHERARDAGLARIRIPGWFPEDLTPAILRRTVPADSVPAVRAIPLALGKGIMEQPMAEAFLRPDGSVRPVVPKDLPGHPVSLHARTVAHMGSLHPELDPSGPEMRAMVQRFSTDLGMDSAFNREVLHTRVHDWFVETPELDFAALNRKVYTELFETPATDPWLGLYDATVFTGLPGGGVERP